MRTPEIVIEYLKLKETLKQKPYKDPELTTEQIEKGEVQQWAIAYGNHYYENGTKVQETDEPISVERADEIFTAAVKRFEQGVTNLFQDVTLTDNQFGALVSLTYNMGLNGFKDTELYKLIKQNPNNPKIKDSWLKCAITAKGQPSTGLVKRREAEYGYYSTGKLILDVTNVTSQSVIFGTEEDAAQNTTEVRVKYVNTNYCNLISCGDDVEKQKQSGSGKNDSTPSPEQPKSVVKSQNGNCAIWSALQIASTDVYKDFKLLSSLDDTNRRISSIQESYSVSFHIATQVKNDWEYIGFLDVELAFSETKGGYYKVILSDDTSSGVVDYLKEHYSEEKCKKIYDDWYYLRTQTENKSDIVTFEKQVVNSEYEWSGSFYKAKKMGFFQRIQSSCRKSFFTPKDRKSSDKYSVYNIAFGVEKNKPLWLLEKDGNDDLWYMIIFQGKEPDVYYICYFLSKKGCYIKDKPLNNVMSAHIGAYQTKAFKYDTKNSTLTEIKQQ